MNAPAVLAPRRDDMARCFGGSVAAWMRRAPGWPDGASLEIVRWDSDFDLPREVAWRGLTPAGREIARAKLAKALEPAGRERAERALAILAAVTKSRAESAETSAARIAAYTCLLAEEPAVAVEPGVREVMRTCVFWPAWAEICRAVARAAEPFRLALAALDPPRRSQDALRRITYRDGLESLAAIYRSRGDRERLARIEDEIAATIRNQDRSAMNERQ